MDAHLILFLFPCIVVDGDSLRCTLTQPQRAIVRKAAPKRYKARKWLSLRIRLKGINSVALVSESALMESRFAGSRETKNDPGTGKSSKGAVQT